MLVFTAGIGEHSAVLRQRICAELGWLGGHRCAGQRDRCALISTATSRVRVAVEPTNEEWIAARHAQRLLGTRPRPFLSRENPCIPDSWCRSTAVPLPNWPLDHAACAGTPERRDRGAAARNRRAEVLHRLRTAAGLYRTGPSRLPGRRPACSMPLPHACAAGPDVETLVESKGERRVSVLVVNRVRPRAAIWWCWARTAAAAWTGC